MTITKLNGCEFVSETSACRAVGVNEIESVVYCMKGVSPALF